MATAPSCGAGMSAKAPPKRPIGVRTAATRYTSPWGSGIVRDATPGYDADRERGRAATTRTGDGRLVRDRVGRGRASRGRWLAGDVAVAASGRPRRRGRGHRGCDVRVRPFERGRASDGAGRRPGRSRV